MPPSDKPSFYPSNSVQPSMVPSDTPTASSRPAKLAGMPSAKPSFFPSTSVVPTEQPSSTLTGAPTLSPVGGMTIRRPAFDPCHDDGRTLVGVVVTLYSAFGEFVDQTVTDEEGYYTFEGLPFGRYRAEIDYPDCGDRRELSGAGDPGFPDDNLAKFYSTGDSCDVSFQGLVSTDGDILGFDTLDECCANLFWYDMEGCFSRSQIAFQFEFCLDISGLGSYNNCPLNLIQGIESAMQKGLGHDSELKLVKFGSTTLINAHGKTKCIGPMDQETTVISNQLRSLADSSGENLNICGVVTTKEAECKEELCLRKAFDKVVVPFQSYFYGQLFSVMLHPMSRNTVHPLHVVSSSFIARKLLLPSTVTSISPKESAATVHSTFTETPRFYPTYLAGELCHSKTSFESWEESYETLRECCEAVFSWDFEACCSSLDMGGC